MDSFNFIEGKVYFGNTEVEGLSLSNSFAVDQSKAVFLLQYLIACSFCHSVFDEVLFYVVLLWPLLLSFPASVLGDFDLSWYHYIYILIFHVNHLLDDFS